MTPLAIHEVTSTLNDLIEICKDGEKGFQLAADHVRESTLKTLLTQFSEQRMNFAQDLEKEIRQLGGEAKRDGSVSGALHRGWLNIKSAVAGESDEAIVAECERGEDAAKTAYHAACNLSLPASALALVRRQYAQVKDTHDRVRALETAEQTVRPRP